MKHYHCKAKSFTFERAAKGSDVPGGRRTKRGASPLSQRREIVSHWL
jgi:hypothetical protein